MRLGVNIDHVATVRQAREAHEPEPVAAAVLAELAGADGITVHLRSDRRHIQVRDLELLKQVVSTKLNVEMAATREMVRIVAKIHPDQITLVPERKNELTTTGGLDVVRHADELTEKISRLQGEGMRVSIFVDTNKVQIRKARMVGADAIEINTGPYADADEHEQHKRLEYVKEAVKYAARQNLEVLAGHGLTYLNVQPISGIQDIVELNIGHSLVSRAVLVGIERAVREMKALLA